MTTTLNRRQLLRTVLYAGAGLTFPGFLPLWARSGTPGLVPDMQTLSGEDIALTIGNGRFSVGGRTGDAVTINGTVPAPLIRLKQGQDVRISVTNTLSEDTSIHWHGVLLPFQMDGVPGVSFPGIRPGETFVYQFPVRHAGTFWYHSHSNLQEQLGHYGPLIFDPAGPDPVEYDREHIVVLSDWTFMHPHQVMRKLKKEAGYFNYQRQTVAGAIGARGPEEQMSLSDRLMWKRMRMDPTDIADVTGATYTYLVNGHGPTENWTGLFRSGERVRLRIINASAMTYFDVRIPGLKMTVVAADGQPIHPVSVDEFRIAVAETFDVIVEPSGQDAWTIFAQDTGRTGYARGTLAVREGLRPPVPVLDPRPLLTMADMGHGGHGEHGAQAAQGDHGGHGGHGAGMQAHPPAETGHPLVDMQTHMPEPKLDDPGIGLRDNGRRTLTYADMRSLSEDPDGREPGRTVELHLTGHMHKFAWSFDARKFADAEPLRLNYGERLRIVLVNDTMMSHPIHLHGMWSDLEDGHGGFHLRKHTVDMPPGTRRAFRVRADALGRWAFHCHLLYHMEAGMMREVRVDE